MNALPVLLSLRMMNDFDALTDRFFDADFGLGYRPVLTDRWSLPWPVRYSPSNLLQKVRDADARGGALTSIGKDGLQINMDVRHFQPNELTVKTIDDEVVVEGKHEERQDEHGFISRQFVRKFRLPSGYDSKEVTSSLSSDGVLTIKAPPPPTSETESTNERIVQIQQTGPVNLSIKEGGEDEKKPEEAEKKTEEATPTTTERQEEKK